MYIKIFLQSQKHTKQDKVGILYSSTKEPSLISLVVLTIKLFWYMLVLHTTIELRQALVLQRVSRLSLMDTRVKFSVGKQALWSINNKINIYRKMLLRNFIRTGGFTRFQRFCQSNNTIFSDLKRGFCNSRQLWHDRRGCKNHYEKNCSLNWQWSFYFLWFPHWAMEVTPLLLHFRFLVYL